MGDRVRTDQPFTAVLCALSGGFAAALYFLAVSHGAIPSIVSCKDGLALNISVALDDMGNWYATPTRLYQKRGKIAVWHANNVYGLGVSGDGYALPDDGNLSLACRSLLYRKIAPRLPKHLGY